jgi:hypothetical protein
MSVRLPPRGPRLAAVRLASLPAERRPLPSPPSAGCLPSRRATAASLPASPSSISLPDLIDLRCSGSSGGGEARVAVAVIMCGSPDLLCAPAAAVREPPRAAPLRPPGGAHAGRGCRRSGRAADGDHAGGGHRRGRSRRRGAAAGCGWRPWAAARSVREGAGNASSGERRRICASRFVGQAKCILCLGVPLERVFEMQKHCVDSFLGLCLIVGVSLMNSLLGSA